VNTNSKTTAVPASYDDDLPVALDIRAKARRVVLLTWELDEDSYETLQRTLRQAGPAGERLSQAFHQAAHQALDALSRAEQDS
jgi:hypothetical protein